MKIITTIQVRMGSTRLPGKVLLPILGEPVLSHMIKRVRQSAIVGNKLVVSTTKKKENLTIRDLCSDLGVYCHCSSVDEEDVFGRMLDVVDFIRPDIIVELTGDCPLVDPKHIDILTKTLIEFNYDYISNDVYNRSWPDGLDIQIYSVDALKKVSSFTTIIREHVGWNIPNNSYFFKIGNRVAPKEYHWPELGLTLDTKEDYIFLLKIYNHFKTYNYFSAEAIIDYLKDNLDIINNKEIIRKNAKKGNKLF